MTTREFIQYANNRPELCEKMAACTSPEEVYTIASAEGLTDSAEDFRETMTAMKNAVELSDEDLDNISAAGSSTGGVVFATVVTALSTSLATCYAAAAV